jgi:surfeit locus 1 family protein
MKRAARIALIVSAALASVGFLALAVWQVQRLGWKQDLIARVEQRLHAAPVAPPARAEWPALGKDDEYRRLRLQGRFEPRETLVQATTELGAGHWVLAPLRLDDGSVVLVNRGFVPPEQRAPERHPAPNGPVELTGLLRLTEPGGGPLRRNEPAENRWYSRDVAGIAARMGLAGPVAPYFVDEAADPAQPQRWPRPGLTVVRFNNNHAVYAATWLALAAMAAAAAGFLVREERRRAPP